MDGMRKKKIGLSQVLGFLLIFAVGKCLVYSWVPISSLFIGADNDLVIENNISLSRMANSLSVGDPKSKVVEIYNSNKADGLLLFNDYDHEWVIRGNGKGLLYASDRLYVYFNGDIVSSNYLAKSEHPVAVRE